MSGITTTLLTRAVLARPVSFKYTVNEATGKVTKTYRQEDPSPTDTDSMGGRGDMHVDEIPIEDIETSQLSQDQSMQLDSVTTATKLEEVKRDQDRLLLAPHRRTQLDSLERLIASSLSLLLGCSS